MKKIFLALTALFFAATALAQSPKAIYNKYSDEKGVSAVYISQAMFKLIGKVPNLEVGDGKVDIVPLIKDLTGMYILSIEKNSEAGQKLYKDVSNYVRSSAYELLMEAKDDGEVMRMYTVGDSKTIKSFVMLAMEPEEVAFIGFEGAIPRDKLEEAIAKAAAN
ncbi:MAG: DUF4252 domain-containing protein [Candidatus Cryptobacteroides sp.]|jgi:hypothetical protein|nr:DUF4252 domain-containing protein [Rikenellaceae bacterium]